MSYSSYNNETPLDLNNVRNIEGLTDVAGMNKKLDEIKSTIADFENKKQLIIDNSGVGKEGMTFGESINTNEQLQRNTKYNKYILPNDKKRKSMVDARIEDSNLLNNSKIALVTSGTATLETAFFEVPQVVCYKTSLISYLIGRLLIPNLKYISFNFIIIKYLI